MTLDDEGRSEGLSEEELVDDAEVDTMIRESLTHVLGDAEFQHSKLESWTANCVEGCLKRLAAFQKPFKYVVTCDLQQKTGAGLHTACCTRWSDKTDGKLTVQWDNATIFALITVFWLAV